MEQYDTIRCREDVHEVTPDFGLGGWILLTAIIVGALLAGLLFGILGEATVWPV